MVEGRRRRDGSWHISSSDPQELAELDRTLRGATPDPDKFIKGRDGRFYADVEIPSLDALPWDEFTFDRPRWRS